MTKTASKVIKIAKAEVGYLEKKTNAQLDSKTANAGYNNYNKYARDMDNIPEFFNGLKNGFYWCAIFVCWCFMKAFGAAEAMKLLFLPENSAGASCTYLAGRFKAKNRLYTSPQVGDLALFTSNGGKTFYHVGIVTKVGSVYVHTVEGNTSGGSGVIANGGGVFEKKYLKTNKNIRYARPDYDAEPTAAAPSKPTAGKTIEQLAQEVIDGVYGDGTARKAALGDLYDEVQAKVNELLTAKDPTPKFTTGKVYHTQVDELSVRTGAGTSYKRKTYAQLTKNAKKYAYASGHLKVGTAVTCLGTKKVGNDIWMKIPSGWCAAYYKGKYYIK